MARHSFVQMSKIPNVKGRIDYISNPKRQENLYATYSTVEPEFWQYLSEQAQHDFWKSNQTKGKCIEARELIIALPESLKKKDPDLLLQLFVQKFQEQYQVHCTAALHHNKAKTNYHIHLIFADREVLPTTQIKRASRNMFFNEEGRHVRTKKEILDAEGNLRPGCRILPKGEVYEMSWFSGRKDIFKSKGFLQQAKEMYTELINLCVDREEDKLTVFDPTGPYLATKKIGKNNPKADEIRSDNQIKQEWNKVVDQVLVAGGTIEEVTEFKREEVVKKVFDSIQKHGKDPGLFAAIIRRGIQILKEFLKILMEKEEPVIEKEPIITVAKVPKKPATSKGPRPDATKEEAAYKKMVLICEELTKVNKKYYALQKQRVSVNDTLDQIPTGFFHRKERKALQERIDGLDRQMELMNKKFFAIPKKYGFENVHAVKQATDEAKKVLEQVRRKQAAWDGYEPMPEPIVQTQKQKVSVLKQLAEQKMHIDNNPTKNKKLRHSMEL